MKKQILKYPNKYTSKKKTKKAVENDWDGLSQETMEWTGTKDMLKSTDSATAEVRTDIYKVNQSINQKVERSEEDVKKRFNEIMIPFLVFQVLNFLLLLTLVVR